MQIITNLTENFNVYYIGKSLHSDTEELVIENNKFAIHLECNPEEF